MIKKLFIILLGTLPLQSQVVIDLTCNSLEIYTQSQTYSSTTLSTNVVELAVGNQGEGIITGTVIINDCTVCTEIILNSHSIEIKELKKSITNDIIFDILGKKYQNYQSIPIGTIYLKNNKKFIKR